MISLLRKYLVLGIGCLIFWAMILLVQGSAHAARLPVGQHLRILPSMMTAWHAQASHPPSTILFVGNSLTSYNGGVHNHFKNLAAASGRNVIVDGELYGGNAFANHYNRTTTMNKIRSGNWEVVVLQGRSDETYKRASSFNTYGGLLAQSAAGAGARPAYFMTWMHRNGASDIDTIQKAYTNLGHTNGAPVAPVGLAYERVKRNYPAISLYPAADNVHSTLAGTYLAASVFYAFFTGESPAGLAYSAALDAGTAQILRQAAWDTVQAYGQFWGSASGSTPTPTPVPTGMPQPPLLSGLPIFTDQLGLDWHNWSWGATVDFAEHNVAYRGTGAIATTYTRAWSGLYLRNQTPVDLSTYDDLHFWIRSTTPGQKIGIWLVEPDAAKSTTVNIFPAANAWTEVTMPLSDFGNIPAAVGIVWQERTGAPQPTMYLDDIAFRSARSAASRDANATKPISPPSVHIAMGPDNYDSEPIFMNVLHLQGTRN